MKPIVTWILLANARKAHVVVNKGPGKGLAALADKTWQAKPAPEHSTKAGIGHSIAGPGMAAVDQGDPQHQADLVFAKSVTNQLDDALASTEFDRLVIVAGPHMLGLLRHYLTNRLRSVLVAEIAKDFSALPMENLEERLAEVIAT